jgi:hypothetical protein
MEHKAPTYNPGHYAPQDRAEFGGALRKNSYELTVEKFREKLDVYDKNWPQVLSAHVERPTQMIQKMTQKTADNRKKKEIENEKTAQQECCEYLNRLIKLLPRTTTS